MATREQELAAIVACLERYPAGKGYTFFSDDAEDELDHEWDGAGPASLRLREDSSSVEYG